VNAAEALERVRAHCLALPGTEERISHGRPAYFAKRRGFVYFMDDHHNDGRLALWCAAPPGMQEGLIGGAPENYFRPPYVGHRGWIGVHLNRGLEWDAIAGAIEEAYLTVTEPKSA
jgi:predicted DNA-binding protein (MmcQ/YjbR family)